MKLYHSEPGIELYQGDAREVLPMISAHSVRLVLTDPPYSEHVHMNQPGNTGFELAGRTVDLGFDSLSPELLMAIAIEIERVAAGWALVFSDDVTVHDWRIAFQLCGMQHIRTGAWVRVNGAPQFSGDRPAVGHEPIEIAHVRGPTRWNGGGRHCVFTCPVVHGAGRVHTTQKPERLIRELVSLFSDPGDLVLDCFAGSGTTARVCKDLGRRFVGVELDPTHCDTAVQRLRQLVLPGVL